MPRVVKGRSLVIRVAIAADQPGTHLVVITSVFAMTFAGDCNGVVFMMVMVVVALVMIYDSDSVDDDSDGGSAGVSVSMLDNFDK